METYSREAEVSGENIPMALLGWVAGCTMIWSGLFSLGNYIYERTKVALMLAVVFAVSGAILVWVVNKLWVSRSGQKQQSKLVEEVTPPV
jgi:hypothetical protein